jgi:hypothetical protein
VKRNFLNATLSCLLLVGEHFIFMGNCCIVFFSFFTIISVLYRSIYEKSPVLFIFLQSFLSCLLSPLILPASAPWEGVTSSMELPVRVVHDTTGHQESPTGTVKVMA